MERYSLRKINAYYSAAAQNAEEIRKDMAVAVRIAGAPQRAFEQYIKGR